MLMIYIFTRYFPMDMIMNKVGLRVTFMWVESRRQHCSKDWDYFISTGFILEPTLLQIRFPSHRLLLINPFFLFFPFYTMQNIQIITGHFLGEFWGVLRRVLSLLSWHLRFQTKCQKGDLYHHEKPYSKQELQVYSACTQCKWTSPLDCSMKLNICTPIDLTVKIYLLKLLKG